jgi:hypothetical protein
MRSGSQTDNQQARIHIAEPRHRTRPILLAPIRAPLHAPDFLTMRY